MAKDLYTDTSGMVSVGDNAIRYGEDYLAEISKIYGYVSDLSNRWKGDDNIAYVNKVNEYKTSLTNLGEVIKNFGTFIKSAAASYEDTQADSISKLSNI